MGRCKAGTVGGENALERGMLRRIRFNVKEKKGLGDIMCFVRWTSQWNFVYFVIIPSFGQVSLATASSHAGLST